MAPEEVRVDMADRTDIAQIDPDLELTFGPHTLECAGTLSVRTRPHVLEAMETVVQGRPLTVDIDVSALRVADREGVTTLVDMERIAWEAGIKVRWRGLGAQHVPNEVAV